MKGIIAYIYAKLDRAKLGESMIKKIGEQLDNVGKDKQGNDRTIYDVGWGTLIGRNLVAGMSRALGSLFLNVLFLVVLGSFLAKFIWPQLQSSFSSIMNASEVLNQFGHTLTIGGERGSLLWGDDKFNIQDLGKPGSDIKSLELDSSQLEQLLFQNENNQP